MLQKHFCLGLNVEDILNLIIVTGDPIPSADKDEIKSVFNFNSTLLMKYIDELNEDLFTNKMNTAGALNINSPKLQSRIKTSHKKRSPWGEYVLYPALLIRPGFWRT